MNPSRWKGGCQFVVMDRWYRGRWIFRSDVVTLSFQEPLMSSSHDSPTDTDSPVDNEIFVTVRIPADWASPAEMIERMSGSCTLTPDRFVSADGTECDLDLRDADDDFARIFAMSCRREPTEEEKKRIENYRVQVCLTARCGSRPSAYRFLRAISHWLDAGGQGVFVDNSGVAFGRQAWRQVFEQIDDHELNVDAITFALVGLSRGEVARTVGMQILGCPDVELSDRELGPDGSELIEMMQYVGEHHERINHGDAVGDEESARFRVTRVDDPQPPGHPMHNPNGRIKLTSWKDIAESN